MSVHFNMKAFILLFLPLIAFELVSSENKLKLVREWKELEFMFPDDNSRLDAESRNHYTRGESLPIDVDVYYGQGGETKIFVTIPRFDAGRPFTLATVNSDPNTNIQMLKPYPDYSWHVNQGTNCNGMTSVFRIAIDECHRLWVVDTGAIGDDKFCPTQILIFDLKTDTLIHRHYISQRAIRPHSLLVTPVIDVRDPHGSCSNTFAYLADVTGYGLVVYDFALDKSWRVENKLMYPFPPEGTFNIQGESFDLMDGIIGMALSPLKNQGDDRTLYFHALASLTENYVKTSVLRNDSAWEGSSPSANARDFRVFKNNRFSQSASEAMDRNGVLFFGLVTPCSMACWNSATEYSLKNMDIIAHDHNTLQFPSGVKIVNNLKGEQELWVLSCRLQKFMTGTLNSNEVNFRIQASKVSKLLKGTKCHRPNGTAFQNNFVGENPLLAAFSNFGRGRSLWR